MAYDRISPADSLHDIITNTPVYGLYNPSNFHSFCLTNSVFVPTACCVCKQLVYPFVSACLCLRCNIVCHRGCIDRYDGPKCCEFTFKDIHTNHHMKRSKEPLHLNSFETNLEIELESIIERVSRIPKILVSS